MSKARAVKALLMATSMLPIQAPSIRTWASRLPPPSTTAMFIGWPISFALLSPAAITRLASSSLIIITSRDPLRVQQLSLDDYTHCYWAHCYWAHCYWAHCYWPLFGSSGLWPLVAGSVWDQGVVVSLNSAGTCSIDGNAADVVVPHCGPHCGLGALLISSI